ncbi:hypothetical protein E2P81_ATG01546 [Venturia nashicola]|nr:hypothetical protein E2P81_ATG01546 [Venturia nashicola]
MLHSPNTTNETSLEYPDEALESPIEDTPMLSITPIEDTINKEEQNLIFWPLSSHGRQIDPETYQRLIGTHPGLTACEQDPIHSTIIKDPANHQSSAIIRPESKARNVVRNK